jgi:hypothetical protein
MLLKFVWKSIKRELRLVSIRAIWGAFGSRPEIPFAIGFLALLRRHILFQQVIVQPGKRHSQVGFVSSNRVECYPNTDDNSRHTFLPYRPRNGNDVQSKLCQKLSRMILRSS